MVHVLDMCFLKVLKKMFEFCACVCALCCWHQLSAVFVCAPIVSWRRKWQPTYSCLENPVDRGAWWAAIYGVVQSRTRLKWLTMHACIGEGNGNPLQYSCLENLMEGESHGGRSLVGYSPQDRKQSDTTEWLHLCSARDVAAIPSQETRIPQVSGFLSPSATTKDTIAHN